MGIAGEDKQPKGSLRPLSGEPEGSRQPEFYKPVNRDLMEFVMKSNQEVKLREELDMKERARIRWNEDGYVLIKYGGRKVDQEFDEQVWKRHCSDIVDAFLDNCCGKDFPLEEEILDEVADQLLRVEGALPDLTVK